MFYAILVNQNEFSIFIVFENLINLIISKQVLEVFVAYADPIFYWTLTTVIRHHTLILKDRYIVFKGLVFWL